MNLKKILAGVVAGAMAVSAMSIAAFAEAAPEKKVVTVKELKEPYAKICTSTAKGTDADVSWVVATADNEKAFESKATVVAENDWWNELEVSVEALIGDVKPADVKSITFSSTANFTVGYNKLDGWGQGETDDKDFVVTDMLLEPAEVNNDIEVNTLVTGEFEAGTKDGDYAAVVYNASYDAEKEIATLTIKDDDVVVVSVTVPEGVDASKMVLTFKGYDSSWSGWKSVSSEEGATSFQTTIKAIREANELEKPEDLFGVNLEISGLADGAKVNYTVGTLAYVTITEKPADVSSSDEAADPDATTDPDATGDPDATTSADADVAGTGTPTGTGDNNQPTGIAIAVVPAVIAAAGVIVAKKRK